MPGIARRKSKSKIYYVMIRGINQKSIFSDDEDNEKFLAILDKSVCAHKYKLGFLNI